MDPVREMIHLGLKVTEAALDRTLGVVRLVDTLLVATAVPTERESTSREPVWPEEEQADLDALSATLRARKDDPAESTAEHRASTKAPTTKTGSPKTTPPKAPAKKSSAKKAPAKKAPAKKASAKTSAKKASAQKTTAQKTTANTRSRTPQTPSLVVLPDA